MHQALERIQLCEQAVDCANARLREAKEAYAVILREFDDACDALNGPPVTVEPNAKARPRL
jgi:hypothetical protein